MALFEPLFGALDRDDVHHVVVGGAAVALHGFTRLTGDVDLALELGPTELRNTMTAFTSLGLCPRLPVPVDDFVDPVLRAGWVQTSTCGCSRSSTPRTQHSWSTASRKT